MSLRCYQPLISRWARKQRVSRAKPYAVEKKAGASNKQNLNKLSDHNGANNETLVAGMKTMVASVSTKATNNIVTGPIGTGSKEDNNGKAFSNHLMEVTDVDFQDKGKPELVPEYVNEIYSHLWALEDKHLVGEHFLAGQACNPWMRATLIDWLIQLQVGFCLLPETLYLTVGIMDRFLQVDRTIPCDQLQLVAVTSMFIASKYEETQAPHVDTYSYITDNAFTKADILNMEIRILSSIDCYVSFPLPLHFLRRNSKAGNMSPATHALAKYLLELCLTEYDMCHYKPSMLAASALCLSMKLLGGQLWTDNLVFYSRYREGDLAQVMCKIAVLVKKSNGGKLQAARNKFSSERYHCISQIPHLKSKFITNLASRVYAV